MKVTSLPPPGNGGFGLGEPFDTRAGLLIAHDDARKELYRRQMDGDRDAIASAAWTVTERSGDLLSHEHDLANAVLMALRFAVKHYPASVSEVVSEVPAVVELADAVAALEDKGVRS